VHNPWIAWIATDTGSVRAKNEDRCFAGGWLSDGSDGAWTVPLEAARWCAVVADGMGGHHAGELASEAALAELLPLADTLDSEEAVNAVLERVNERVFEAMYSPRGRVGMGCTVAGVAFNAGEAIFFNVGDSRAYVLRGSEILQLSLDHTLGIGKTAHARSHLLTQSLGGSSRRRALAPHVKRKRLAESDVILLCSDGLTDMLSEEEILDVLFRSAQNPAHSLAAAAVDAGGHDNVTVIVIGRARELNAGARRDQSV
jgi:serine/threonine protein phosphatase PrpC